MQASQHSQIIQNKTTQARHNSSEKLTSPYCHALDNTLPHSRGCRAIFRSQCWQPGVVYALSCKDSSKVHVGETGRTAKKRTDEHLRHTMQANTDMSAFAQHVLTTDHSIHWKPQVLVKESNPKRRKVREALTIHRLGEKAMNQDKGTNISKL